MGGKKENIYAVYLGGVPTFTGGPCRIPAEDRSSLIGSMAANQLVAVCSLVARAQPLFVVLAFSAHPGGRSTLVPSPMAGRWLDAVYVAWTVAYMVMDRLHSIAETSFPPDGVCLYLILGLLLLARR